MGRPARIALLSATAVLALLATSCSGMSRSPAVASIGSPNSAGASHPASPSAPTAAGVLATSRCMRSHGVPSFPDPMPVKGHLVFGFSVKSRIHPSSPQFKAAYKYCRTRYLGLSHRPGRTPAAKAQANAAAVKFTACMRSHGAADFPDPDGQGAIYLPTANYIDTPKVQRAEGSCKSLLAGHGFVLVSPVP